MQTILISQDPQVAYKYMVLKLPIMKPMAVSTSLPMAQAMWFWMDLNGPTQMAQPIMF